MKRRWSRAAERHLADIHEFIAKDNPAAAVRTVRRVVKATARLERYPESGRPGSVAGTREVVVPGLPYVVVYEVVEGAVEIHGVFHTAREPKIREGGTENENE